MTKFLNISTDNTLGGNSPSDEIVSSQKAIKEYIASSGTGANTSLSNLTTIGQNIGNWSSNVTNCITEISQDIKLELSNGTLTLKAGSKVYVPNGFEVDGTTRKFDVVTIANDISDTISFNGTCTVVYQPSDNIISFYSSTVDSSGSTDPSATATFYNTTQNIMKRFDGSSLSRSGFSFPIARVVTTTSGVQSIKEILNGLGYIGICRFILPGVSGLIPNGLNTDGSYKNIKFTNQSVRIYNVATTIERNFGLILDSSGNIVNDENSGTNNKFVGLAQNRPTTVANTNNNYWYSIDENQWYNTSGSTTANWQKAYPFFLGKINGTATSTTYFEQKSSFSAADRDDREFFAHQAMPSNKRDSLTLGSSGTNYIAPADGWFLLNKTVGTANTKIEMYNSSANFRTITPTGGLTTGTWAYCSIPAKKGDTVQVGYTVTGTTNGFHFVYAQGAK